MSQNRIKKRASQHPCAYLYPLSMLSMRTGIMKRNTEGCVSEQCQKTGMIQDHAWKHSATSGRQDGYWTYSGRREVIWGLKTCSGCVVCVKN